MHQKKTFTPQLKLSDSPGAIEVEFATLNVVDLDGDVTLPGAFGKQGVRIQPHSHDTFSFSIGKGTIKEVDDKAVLEGQLNLDMQSGREAYFSLKFDMENGDPLQEWSYIFDIVEAEMGEFKGMEVRFLKKMTVFSVDPVFLGAGISTRTTRVKGEGGFIEHLDSFQVEVEELLLRVKSRESLLGKEGRTFSSSNVEKLSAIATALKTAGGDLENLLRDAEPAKSAPSANNDELIRLRLQYEQIRSGIQPLISGG